MSYEKELEVGLAAVKKAARLCRKVQQQLVTLETIEKKDKSPVTIADLGSQAVISLDLLKSFPGDPIVGEEEADMLKENRELCRQVHELVVQEAPDSSAEQMIDAIAYGAEKVDFTRRYWTVDPIDGTKGFLRGEQYAVALALVDAGEVVLGILGCPNYAFDRNDPDGPGSIFFAVKGQGAAVQSTESGEQHSITTDGIADGAQAKFCESVEAAHASHDDHARISAALGIVQPPYRIDSQAKYAAVASGNASIYLRLPRSSAYREKIWDHAAGAFVVAAAGGKVTDFSGNPLDFTLGITLENNVGILATNGPIHDKVLEAIKKEITL